MAIARRPNPPGSTGQNPPQWDAAPRVALVSKEQDGGELRQAVESEGMIVRIVTDLNEVSEIAKWQPHIVVLDVVEVNPELSPFMSRVRSQHRCACVVVVAESSGEALTLAAECNADAVLVRPIDPVSLRRSLLQEARSTKGPTQVQVQLPALVVGSTPQMREVWRFVLRAAQSTSSVVITGETGVGKEVIARALHRFSSRKSGPFVAVNCAALPETLMESELFGYEKGAFTGATAQHKGRFELADGGTLFLDEIGDLPLGVQVKLLRVLQEQTFERLGGTESISVDVRVIAATHRRLEEEVERGRFRADLFYRLNVLSTEVPPLRERTADILGLWEHFVDVAAQQERRRAPVSTAAVQRMLLRHDWPGNIRELHNVVQHAMAVSTGDRIVPADLPAYLSKPTRAAVTPESSRLVGRTMKEIERAAILETYEALGTVKATAEMLGISERKIHYRLKSYRADTEPAQPSAVERANIEPERGRARVLLAEDDDELRWLLTDVLKAEGHEVVAVSDGSALLAHLGSSLLVGRRGAPPDIIITDIRMPGASGLQVLEKVRAKSGDLPVVLITAFGDSDTKKQAESLGATALLDKPLDIDQLQKVVRGSVVH
jgi:DNA-binding NtrC family response regulator